MKKLLLLLMALVTIIMVGVALYLVAQVSTPAAAPAIAEVPAPRMLPTLSALPTSALPVATPDVNPYTASDVFLGLFIPGIGTIAAIIFIWLMYIVIKCLSENSYGPPRLLHS